MSEDVEVEIDAETQADATPHFKEEAMLADEFPIQTSENQTKEYTPKRIRADATNKCGQRRKVRELRADKQKAEARPGRCDFIQITADARRARKDDCCKEGCLI